MAGEKMEEKKAEEPAAAPSGDKDYRMWAAICYVLPVLGGILVLVTDKKNDKKLVFHAWQSIIAGVVLWALSFILSIVLIGCLVGPLGYLLMLFWAYKLYSGEEVEVPTICEYARKQVK
jgi:uncharacterized membrane protein